MGAGAINREFVRVNEAASIEDRYMDQRYELSGRLIDPIGGSVTYADERILLKRKHLEVLACLVSAKDAMVTRRALIDLVWNGNALIGDTGLTNAVYYLRRALQDTDADKPLIRTVPRRGYQLTAQARVTDNSPTTTFSPGSPVVGKPEWHLSRLLSSNPVSETWLAEEQGSQAQRVFRFCRSEQHLRLLRRETAVMRYLREALVGRKDTAIILDWQLDEPPYYLEMDCAAHGTLAQWAASQGGLSRIAPAERMRLIGEIAGALVAVHAASVVHRNLSATSILIDSENDKDNAQVRARLGEFGWSDLTDRTRLESMKITSAGLTLIGDEGIGEQRYLAPECLAGQAATTASDVYALGVLLVQLVVGDLQRTISADWERDIGSHPLRAMIAACTDAQAERRPSAAAVCEQLNAFAMATGDRQSDGPVAERSPDPGASSAPLSMIGQTIGPYRVLDQLGEGGMGAVYLAEQREPVQRKVALKLIKTGMDSKQVLARFEAERQALALMSHANVATVYDAGSTPSGQPYFAMEHVRGLDITAHCDQLDMDFRERIALFLQACEGVLHAHQKGLIHRDLKPGNILVSRAQDQPATVKIIDFGVAKSLSGVLTGHAAHTRLGSFVGTPAYSSPEQVSGPLVNVDTRTDIYSLGVVLYQLLAGVTPYSEEELNRKTPVELARLLSAERPPSLLARFSSLSVEDEGEIAKHRSLSVERMKVLLGADVSWIVGKCLESDPDDRYPSVLELEKDLRRWLDDKPIEARPASRMYRARKFVRRHRTGVALASLMTLALLITTTAAVIGFVRAEHALRAARAATVEAEKAADFQVKRMESLDPAAMGIGLRSALIAAVQKRGAERGWDTAAVAQGQTQLDSLIEGVNFTDLTLGQLDTYSFKPALASIKNEFGDSPLLQARLWQTMAKTMVDLGLREAAVEPQRLALEQNRRLLGVDDPLTLATLRNRGALRMRLGQLDEAAADIHATMIGMRRVLGNDHPETLDTISEMVGVLVAQGKYDEAEALSREALAGRRGVLGNDHPDTLRSISEVSSVLFERGNYKEALAYAQESLEGHRRVLGNTHPETLVAIVRMAGPLWKMHKLSEAEALVREALEGNRRLLGDRHPNTLAMINNLAILLKEAGRLDEAEAYMRQTLDARSMLIGAEHPETLKSLGNLSSVLEQQGRYAEAELLYRQALDGKRRSLGDNHPSTLTSAGSLAGALRDQGKLDEAATLYKKTLAARRKILGNEHRDTLLTSSQLASVLRMEGELNAANALLQEALQALRRTLGDSQPDTLKSISEMGALAEAQGDLKRAETLLREALAGQRQALGDDDMKTLITIDRLSQVLRQRGELHEAVVLGRELTETAPRALDARHYLIGTFLTHHGRTLLDMRQFEEAERMFDKASANLSQGYNSNKQPVEQLVQGYIALYEQWHAARPGTGLDTKAELWRKKLQALKKSGTQPAAAVLSGK
jgi:eukaryotic-like serine/threonine-protein kinase